MSEPRFTLDADSLLSKWGFGDGDALNDWWWDNYDEEPPFGDHEMLYALVVAHLLPKMREAGWDVELVRISTIHNPVRAERLNGVEVDHYVADHPSIPIEASVTREQIEALLPKEER